MCSNGAKCNLKSQLRARPAGFVFASIWFLCFAGFSNVNGLSDRPFSVDWKLGYSPLRYPRLNSTCFADADSGWAVGDKGTILATNDGGKDWQAQVSGTDKELHGVYFADARNGWAVGDGGTILATRDGGESWKVQSSGTDKVLYSVYFADPHTGWAVGARGTILATRDGGESWEARISGTDKFLYSVYFADASTGWAVGARGTILATRDGGESWKVQSSGRDDSLFRVYFADPHSGWAVGNGGRILATRDGGESWKVQFRGVGNTLRGVCFADPRIGWAVGDRGTILATRDGGEDWEAKSSGTDKTLYDVHFPNARTGWAVGDLGTILATDDGGEDWQAQVAGGTDKTLRGVYFADADSGWAVGDKGTILATRNGGDTWQVGLSGSDKDLYGVYFVDADSGWAVGDKGTILATRNGGKDWQAEASGTDEYLNAVYFVDARIGWAVGYGGTILATNDGGGGWQVEHSGSHKVLRCVYFADAHNGWAVGGPPLGDPGSGTILATSDGGDTWQVRSKDRDGNPLDAYPLCGVYFSNARTGWAVGDMGTILATDDGGESWQAQSSSTYNTLNGVYFADARSGWAVGANGTILATRNGGKDWQAQGGGPDTTLFGVYFADARTGSAVGGVGTILKAGPPIYSPWIDKGEAKVKNDLTGNVELSFLVHAESGEAVSGTTVEYKTKGGKKWEKLEDLKRPDLEGRWNMKWNPANLGLATDQDIEYQVSVDDGRPPLAPFELGAFRYQPWLATAWQHYHYQILGLAGLVSLLAAYLAAFGIMLWLVPARLAGVADAIGTEEIKKPEGPWGILLVLLLRVVQSTVLPWFVRRPRVRRAWTRLYLAGRARLEQLSKRARESFLNETDFLDAWVQARLARVRAALDQLDLVRQRRVYVTVPVRVGEVDTGEMIEQPDVETLRRFFARPRAILSIVGDGGSGKSTLACALARWAMASQPEERLMPHQMLPVFIVEDTENLLESLARNLRRMLGEEELPDDLLRGLLVKQRLLTIVDALSERELATQRHIENAV